MTVSLRTIHEKSVKAAVIGWLVLGLVGTPCLAWAQPYSAQVDKLQLEHAQWAGQLENNQFGRPLVLVSTESTDGLRGDIYATLAYPLKTVNQELRQSAQWCEVMILHINTKYCHASAGTKGVLLRVHIGKKTPQNLPDVAQISFIYSQIAEPPDYFAVSLKAKEGPLGSHDYSIGLEAIGLPGEQTFVHLAYAYRVGLAGRLATQAYLATTGADKVGFTRLGTLANGQAQLIGGMRGVVERNAMRYFLAIDSFLAAQSAEPSVRLEARLQNWFTAVEQYPRQLHEMDRSSYLLMKRAEHARQQTVY